MPEALTIIDESVRPKASVTERLGARGEEIAARALLDNGYRLVMRNFKVPVGRNSKGVQVTGEIDIIALEGDTICFVEVKARSVTQYAQSCETISSSKQKKIMKSALCFLNAEPQFQEFYCRFDVICFDFFQQFAKKIQQDFSKCPYDQQWIENAFTFDQEFINL